MIYYKTLESHVVTIGVRQEPEETSNRRPKGDEIFDFVGM